jgi:hypothetical protein
LIGAQGLPQDSLAAVGQLGGGLLALAAIVFTARSEVRKGQSDVESVTDSMALSMMKQQDAQIAAQDRRINELLARQAELEDRERQRTRYLQVHIAWDFLAADALRRAGVTIEDPPPLYPPREQR